MLFNSILFLLAFLPATLLAFHVVPARFKLWVLLAASLVFYGAAGIEPLVAMLLAIGWVHIVLMYREPFGRRLSMCLVVAFPMLLLVLFRYLDFILDSTNAGEETRAQFSFFLDILVPAGISFYTFQLVGYGIDVLDDKVEREPKLYRLATFIALFPQLVAGPIVRFIDMKDQLLAIQNDRPQAQDHANGYRLIATGLIYKIVFADGLNLLHSQSTGAWAITGLGDRFTSILIYSFQIYYDFMGYSLVAIGLGLIIGIRLPLNFLRPYLSPNPKTFWRRWHVTLSVWLRDYVYFRLGGNKNYVRNIIIVFLAVGLWHGADWSFVVWGAYHAALVLGYAAVAPNWDRLPHALQVMLTFVLVSFGWPLFYLDLDSYVAMIVSLTTPETLGFVVYQAHELIFVACIGIWTFAPEVSASRVKSWLWQAMHQPVIQAASIAFLLMLLPLSTPFIYFRF